MNINVKKKSYWFIASALLAIVMNMLVMDLLAFTEPKKTEKEGANTDLFVDMSDTAQISDIEQKLAQQQVNDVNIAPINSYETQSSFDEQSKIDEMNRIAQEQNASLTNKTTPPNFETYNPPAYRPSQRKVEVWEDDYNNVSVKNKVEKTEKAEVKKRGFNTIESDNSSNQNISNNSSGKIKGMIPTTQLLTNGSKVKIKLKEDFGNKSDGEIVYGLVKISSNQIDIEINGNQFGEPGIYYCYFGGQRGIAYNNNELLNDVKQEGRSEAGMIAGDIVGSIPLLGRLGTRVLSRAGNSRRANVVEVELASGEKLYISK